MAIQRVQIEPNLIQWAILRAGYELETYLSEDPKVKSWLDAKTKPTVRQLEDFTNRVHVPFGYMFLDNPPVEEIEIPFFRAGKSKTDKISLGLFETVHIIKRRQEWLSEYLQEEGDEPLPFVGSFSIENTVPDIVDDIRKTLDIPLGWAGQLRTMGEVINYLIAKIEDKGIIINFNGIVGNNTHRSLDVEECRGFVLIDEYAPFLFINSKDAQVAQVFTILHELAHIWLGVSAGFDNNKMEPADDEIELLCDKVAAEFLVPKKNLLEIYKSTGELDFDKLFKYFKVSPIVIARRSTDIGLIGRAEYFAFYNQYTAKRAIASVKKGKGGNYYASMGRRTSRQFFRFVDSAVKQKKLLYTEAYKLTASNSKTYTTFANDHL